MSHTLDELHTIALRAKPDITEYMNCGYINEQIVTALQNEGIAAEKIIGSIWQSRSKREEHCYVRVPTSETAEGVREVIIDGAIKQFNEQNRDDLWVVLGPIETLPEVTILTYGDDWFSYYLPDRP